MEYDIVLFWFVVLVCVSGLFVLTTRVRLAGFGWIGLYLAILLTSVIGRVLGKSGLIFAAFAMWIVWVLLPGLLSNLYYRQFLQQRYSAALRLARIIGWLHPVDGWRQQPEIVRGLELAQRGELSRAVEVLSRFEESRSIVGLVAIASLYRITGRWEQLMSWEAEHRRLEPHPQLLPVLLRACGETGDVSGMVHLYERNRHSIRLLPAASRDLCRVVLFAFCGRRASVEQLLSGTLDVLPATTRQFWLATADWYAGQTESAKRQLQAVLPVPDPPLRIAIERRLAGGAATSAPLDPSAEALLEEVARESGHESSFGAQRSLLSREARATQLLIVLNLLMFTAEIWFGGATNPGALYRLGALFPPAVHAGGWWRLVASLFLHFGPLHLAMNMFALWVLGPFVEFALGAARFLLVYFVAGVGSMAAVLVLGSGPNGDQITVGASGCIMALVGATAALMVRGWLREKALSARRRFTAMLAIVAMQTVFDWAVPQVSMTGHLSGVLIGFLMTLMLRDRLRSASSAGTTNGSPTKGRG
jgi:rhomboid protease GluP